jgi:hypothetical protein
VRFSVSARGRRNNIRCARGRAISDTPDVVYRLVRGYSAALGFEISAHALRAKHYQHRAFSTAAPVRRNQPCGRLGPGAQWRGGTLPVVVTLLGWVILIRGVVLLFLPRAATIQLVEWFRFDEFLYLYLGFAAALGHYLAVHGFLGSAGRPFLRRWECLQGIPVRLTHGRNS